MKLSDFRSSENMILVLIFTVLIGSYSNFSAAQSLNAGNFSIPPSPGWTYSSDESSGDYLIFKNIQLKAVVSFRKEPAPCPTPQEFNKLIIPLIQSIQREQWIIEQRKPAAPFSFAGQSNSHYMKLRYRTSGERKYVLNPLVKGKMYQIEIQCETLLDEPPGEILDFISQVSTTDSPALVAKKNPGSVNPDPNVLISVSGEQEPQVKGAGNLSD